MTPHFDVAVIGGGIVGVSHAWMAARRKLRVVLLERSAAADGASVRNFGMIWPVGQPAGELHALALRSRELWLELNSLGAVEVAECGSIHLAHHPDEVAIQEEFCRQATHGVRMLTAQEVAGRTPWANTDGLLAGMLSPLELRVDPRSATARITSWLTETQNVVCCFRTPVIAIDQKVVCAADGRLFRADHIVICSGSDLVTLYPDIFATSGLVLCKLQMLKTAVQSISSRAAPHLAGGLTLRHYPAFRGCPSQKLLQARIEKESPELNRFGIHVMASQLANGEVILGDSHEYGEEIESQDKPEIDNLILREARKVFRLHDWTIGQRWNGTYSKHPSLPVFSGTAQDNVHLFAGTGGSGMTLSFGLAEQAWNRWTGETT